MNFWIRRNLILVITIIVVSILAWDELDLDICILPRREISAIEIIGTVGSVGGVIISLYVLNTTIKHSSLEKEYGKLQDSFKELGALSINFIHLLSIIGNSQWVKTNGADGNKPYFDHTLPSQLGIFAAGLYFSEYTNLIRMKSLTEKVTSLKKLMENFSSAYSRIGYNVESIDYQKYITESQTAMKSIFQEMERVLKEAKDILDEMS